MVRSNSIIIIFFSLFNYCCQDSNQKEGRGSKLSNITRNNESELFIYSYPSEKNNIAILVNDSIIIRPTTFCDSIPGCLVYTIKKSGNKSKINFILKENNIDTTFTLNNDSVFKIIYGINPNFLSLFTNQDENAWLVEY